MAQAGVKVGDKVKIRDGVNKCYYSSGAVGIVLDVSSDIVDVQFSEGNYLRGYDDCWFVKFDEFEVIGVVKTKKEKEVKEIKLKGNVYAVVLEDTGATLEFTMTREVARIIRNDYKEHNPTEKFKIVKLVADRFVS